MTAKTAVFTTLLVSTTGYLFDKQVLEDLA
jgi:hypothetical protein